MKKPIDLIIENAKNFYLEKNFLEEESCYKKIYKTYNNNINVLQKLFLFQIGLERWKSAFECCSIINEIETTFETINNLGLISIKLNNLLEAENYYRKSILIKENYKAFEGLGDIYKLKENFEKAEHFYKKSLQFNNKNYSIFIQLGLINKAQGKYKEAKLFLKEAIKLDPDKAQGYQNLVSIEIATKNKYDQIKNLLIKSNNLGKKDFVNSLRKKEFIPFYKLSFDYNQLSYLSLKRKLDSKESKYLKFLNKKLKDSKNIREEINISNEEIEIIEAYMTLNKDYIPIKINKNFLNKSLDWEDIEKKYLNSRLKIVTVDNFLEEETIEELRNFYLESNIWNHTYENKNYLGSLLGLGNYSTIHEGIIIELKNNLKKILKNNDFQTLWAFNYDNLKNKGISLHADFAKINLNFWITPDKYNQTKNFGGLKIYDKPAPKDWTYNDYNSKDNKINEYLLKSKAKSIDIPYKFNRLIIFDSSLFHETQNLTFSDEFIGRRINNTFLFGSRNQKIR